MRRFYALHITSCMLTEIYADTEQEAKTVLQTADFYIDKIDRNFLGYTFYKPHQQTWRINRDYIPICQNSVQLELLIVDKP